MINQLKVESIKLRRFWLLYIASALCAVMGFLFGFLKFSSANTLYDTFAAVVGDTSFMFIISLVIAWFIGNDFSTRTVHNEIKIGCSRLSVLLSKSFAAFPAAIIIHFSYVLAVLVGFCLKNGFDTSLFTVRNLMWTLVVALQIIALQSLTALIVFVLKRAAAAIAASVCIAVVMCNVLRNFFGSELFSLSCFCMAQKNDNRTLVLSALYALALCIFFLGISYALFRKAAVK